MIKINIEKCEKCAHNDICKNSGYIDKLVELRKMIKDRTDFGTVNINLICEYYEEKTFPLIPYLGENKICLDDYLKSPTVTPLDINFTKACNCALPAITGSTECCKNCQNNTTKERKIK